MSIRLIIVLVALLLAGAAQAQLYGSNKNGELFIVDTSTGAGTLVGTLTGPCGGGEGGPGVTDIEYDPVSGRVYAQNPNGAFNGYEFDIASGAALGGCITTLGSNTGIETVNGVWYATVIFQGGGASPSDLHILDPFNGNVETVIGSTGVGAISGLAYNVTSGIMYGIAGGPGPANLYTINLATGAATVVGTTSMQAGSLQFGPYGQLFAGGTGSDADLIYQINTQTAASTLVGPTGFTSNGVTGLTLVPLPPNVPVPTLSYMALFLLALILVLGSLRYFRHKHVT